MHINMSKYITKRLTETGTFVVPASDLDNILTLKNFPIEYYSIHSPIDGSVITSSFYDQIVSLTKAKQYTTTDHTPIVIKFGDLFYIYLSLDNSVRANSYGFPLKNRLGKLCDLIKRIIKEIGSECIIFFSESCRPSFDGSNINDRKNEMTWFEMREFIETNCALSYLGESTNNDDLSGMSFGVSAFCTITYKSHIHTILPRKILTEGFGSGAIGVKTKNGNCVWGIHFPLDFKSKGTDNLGAKTMVNLCTMMKTMGNCCAFGDFNTIPGHIADTIKASIDPELEFVVHDENPTFFGSFYDEVNISDRIWYPLTINSD